MSTIREFTRSYHVSTAQMRDFRQKIEAEPKCRLKGTENAGDLYIATGIGEAILSYVHNNGHLEVTLVAAPGFIRRESIFAKIEELIEQLTAAGPQPGEVRR